MILLDTHVAYWLLFDDKKIPEYIKDIINSQEDEIYLSTISLYEIECKHAKYPNEMIVNAELMEKLAQEAHIKIIPFNPSSLYEYQLFSLQKIHNDPFDLALLSVCLDREMMFLTHDSKIKNYSGVPIIYF